MTEKSALLEKQAEMLQMGAESSNRTFAMHQELDTVRREKMMLESTVRSLQDAAQVNVHTCIDAYIRA
jgi:hypothetical protein